MTNRMASTLLFIVAGVMVTVSLFEPDGVLMRLDILIAVLWSFVAIYVRDRE